MRLGSGGPKRFAIYRQTHELRNELVEELIVDLVSESHAEQDVESVRDGRTSGMESKKRQKKGRIENQPGKEAMRLHTEKQACPRRGTPTAVKTVLKRRQTQRGGKGFWDAEHSDRHLARCWDSRVTSEPLCPAEARVRAQRAGKDHCRFAWRSGDGRWQAHLDVLVSHELHTGTPMLSAAPVAPEQRRGTNDARMKKHTHLARLCRGVAIPLTLLTQWTKAAIADAGCIHDAQAPIDFLASLLGTKRMSCWTLERPIRLERKVLSRETTRFPGGGGSGWVIPSGGSR